MHHHFPGPSLPQSSHFLKINSHVCQICYHGAGNQRSDTTKWKLCKGRTQHHQTYLLSGSEKIIPSTAVDFVFFLANRLTTPFQPACSTENAFSVSYSAELGFSPVFRGSDGRTAARWTGSALTAQPLHERRGCRAVGFMGSLCQVSTASCEFGHKHQERWNLPDWWLPFEGRHLQII